MQKIKIILIILTVIFQFSCSNNQEIGNEDTKNIVSSDNSSDNTIRGFVRIPGMNNLSNCYITVEKQIDGVNTVSIINTINYQNTRLGIFDYEIFSVLTDEKGYFEVTGLSYGKYTVTVKKQNTLGAILNDIEIKDITRGVTIDLDIVLTPTGSVSGNVTLADMTGDYYGTFVYAEGTSYIAATDSSGNFKLDNIPIGTYNLIYYHSDYFNQFLSNVTINAAQITTVGNVVLNKISQSLSNICILQNSVEVSSYNFGNVDINTFSAEAQFEIKNTGTQTLYLTGIPKIKISGTYSSEYIIDQSSLSGSILAGTSSYFTVKFNPKGTGYTRNAELLISSSDLSKNPLRLYLYGNGAGPTIYLSTRINGISYSDPLTTVDFGTCGKDSKSYSEFTLYNNYFLNTILLLTGTPLVEISGTNADQFILDLTNLNSSIPYTDYNNKFNIQFAPTSTGSKTATVIIPNNVDGKSPYTFTITGTALEWDKRIDGGEGDGEDQIVDSVKDVEGNIYVLGYGYEIVSNYSGKDWWIKKYDSSGNEDLINWNKKIDFNNSSNVPLSIAKDSSNNIYVSGSSNIKKFSSSGIEDIANWNKTFGGYIRVDNSNNVYLFLSNKIRKFSSAGVEDTTNWNKTITGFTINDVKFNSSNNVYVAGYGANLVNSFSGNDWWIKKYSSSGVEDTANWDKKVDGGQSNDDKAHSIVIDSFNNIYIIGSGYDLLTGYSKYSGWIKKYGSNGAEDIIWNKIISLPYSYLYPKIAIDSLNNVYITDLFNIKKFNSSGVEDLINWNKYDTSFYKISIVIDNSDNLYVSGYADRLVSSYSDDDWWIKKYNSSGVEQ